MTARIDIRAFLAADYPGARALWERTEGLGLSESDSEEAIASFLERNPGMSAVAATAAGEVVGAVLCGHDGRRGYLHHLAVAAEHRGRGIARALLEHCCARLGEARISRCSIFLYRESASGVAFWLHNGWSEQAWMVLQKRLEA